MTALIVKEREREREGHDDVEREKRMWRARKQHGKFKLREVACCSGEMDGNKVVGRNDMENDKYNFTKDRGRDGMSPKLSSMPAVRGFSD